MCSTNWPISMQKALREGRGVGKEGGGIGTGGGWHGGGGRDEEGNQQLKDHGRYRRENEKKPPEFVLRSKF